jgi:hypothetical protein
MKVQHEIAILYKESALVKVIKRKIKQFEKSGVKK